MRILPILLLVACAPKAPTETAAKPAPGVKAPAFTPRVVPDPLPNPGFTMPKSTSATLSNGLEVRLVENHEVPLWTAYLLFRAGSPSDPQGKEGLNAVTFDMMDEGAGRRSAGDIAGEAKRLGGTIGTSGGVDRSSLSVSGPVRNMEALLDLWTEILRKPTFPTTDWERMRERRVAKVRQSLETPTGIAARLGEQVAWGDTYSGRHTTEETYGAITTADMKAHHATHLRPDNALLLLGGDLDLATVVPMLEARLSSWKAPAESAPVTPVATPATFDKATIHLVDKPGAAQTVLKTVLPANMPTDADYRALDMGVTVLGGAFTARMNMNLREDKGYTYGARCRLTNNLGPNTFGCSTSVATDVTIPALKELMSEISDIRADRPATQAELDYFKGYRIYGFQGRYETPAALLQQVATIWNYSLPENWLEQFVPSIEAVDLGATQTALNTWLDTDRIAYVVVGDKATFGEELAGLGLPIVEYDRHGNLLETP